MPNWCYNNLTVIGKEADVNNFIDDNCGAADGDQYPQPLLFSKSAPEPELEEGEWYNWRIENWGTKWEPNFEGATEIETREIVVKDRKIKLAIYSFDTAWGPADRWLGAAAGKYPDLTFCLNFSEGGMDFGGNIIYKDGELYDESDGNYAEYAATDGFWY